MMMRQTEAIYFLPKLIFRTVTAVWRKQPTQKNIRNSRASVISCLLSLLSFSAIIFHACLFISKTWPHAIFHYRSVEKTANCDFKPLAKIVRTRGLRKTLNLRNQASPNRQKFLHFFLF